MTEQEAWRILNEARSECPSFVRGRLKFCVLRSGNVSVWEAVGKSGMRWKSSHTIARDEYWRLPKDVRERLEPMAVSA